MVSSNSTSKTSRPPSVHLEPPPHHLQQEYNKLFTDKAVDFTAKLVRQFDPEIETLYRRRVDTKLKLDSNNALPDYPAHTAHIRNDKMWRVDSVPVRAKCRKIDCGDVSPSNTAHFKAAMNSPAQGIQTDFDDGHCPNWVNQIVGLSNVYDAVHDQMTGVPPISHAPILMLRPRAWNMVEHNFVVDGKEIPGPCMDFALLMYHNAVTLYRNGSGPFFYLSKVEGYMEARLWNSIFVWTQEQLGLPHGSIKACVLIENILASFEMDEILWELKHHSLGLNCGIWDYSASFINKFGYRRDFMLPDRSKYVNMKRHFLKSYMHKLIHVCHTRGAHATGGMHARVLPDDDPEKAQEITNIVCRDKQTEIAAGCDGFMVYDVRLVSVVLKLFNDSVPGDNQINLVKSAGLNIMAKDLLLMPSGGVTIGGLKHNIGVGILFINAWLNGQGHYVYKGCVEDSATAEISRSQVWQWLRHAAVLEDDGSVVSKAMVYKLIQEFVEQAMRGREFVLPEEKIRLITSARVFNEIVSKRDFPEFITTYLNLEHSWNIVHSKL